MIKLLYKTVFLLFLFSACTLKNEDILKIDEGSLINEFRDANKISNDEYKNKIVQITGRIVEKGFPKDNTPFWDASYVLFGKVDHEGNYLFNDNTIIVCYFDKIVVHDLNVGEVITVQCKFKKYNNSYGRLNSIVFNKGKIISKM